MTRRTLTRFLSFSQTRIFHATECLFAPQQFNLQTYYETVRNTRRYLDPPIFVQVPPPPRDWLVEFPPASSAMIR